MGKKQKCRQGEKHIPIDWNMVNKLCGIQCTAEEIASALDISSDTLYRACLRIHGVTFAEYFKLKKGGGKVSLRRMQWLTAQKGNPTMQIWLGKQYLDQKDKHELDGSNLPTPTVIVLKDGSKKILGALEEEDNRNENN